ncbi:hypothetical protein RCO28_08970 [Streptomyces sp. LHD-70]|uniref:hypothetical protein n=1 Tax=Streptomyces sp. LHD-70 TaxID=3072140 RepID=UPI00280DC362|nr:hypothetical protein [Streptomyces sp. LHD-70]MDQ8702617.1 hypothetical protein [Streptomyces sp. LHD-70]
MPLTSYRPKPFGGYERTGAVASHPSSPVLACGIFLWVLVILMAVNGAFLTLLYGTYAKDVTRVQEEPDRRRTAALAP